MDSDALLVRGDKTPTDMYEDLAFDGKGAEATMRHMTPGLIVNKPFTGWLCSECEKFGLGHGCFNSFVLLWHRERAEPVLRAWWESRNTDESHNFVRDGEWFHGWTSDEHAGRVGDDMGEQNRLMYVFATDPGVREAVWPVPRERSEAGSESCPSDIDEAHTPCLQDDSADAANWNPNRDPSCYVNHYADSKDDALKQARAMIDGDRLV